MPVDLIFSRFQRHNLLMQVLFGLYNVMLTVCVVDGGNFISDNCNSRVNNRLCMIF